ncbi:UrcA family protein [uncultured Sphingomonas sp.]|uniref:UrcA family protein n=1 Tax=uncultured Sphingomonas sp. TaxID=158754 RepID=UPI0035CB963E
MTKLFAALTVSLLALAAAPASARSGAWPIGNHQIHLYYADLDMNSVGGRAAFLARVEKAARKLCRDVRMNDRRECEADTLRITAGSSRNQMLARAMGEREGVRLAGR